MRRLAVLVGKFGTALVIIQIKLRFEVLTVVNIKAAGSLDCLWSLPSPPFTVLCTNSVLK